MYVYMYMYIYIYIYIEHAYILLLLLIIISVRCHIRTCAPVRIVHMVRGNLTRSKDPRDREIRGLPIVWWKFAL